MSRNLSSWMTYLPSLVGGIELGSVDQSTTVVTRAGAADGRGLAFTCTKFLVPESIRQRQSTQKSAIEGCKQSNNSIIYTHINPEGRVTTPSSSFFLARKAKPSWLVPAATEATAMIKKRIKERREIMISVPSVLLLDLKGHCGIYHALAIGAGVEAKISRRASQSRRKT